jgi:eukaryotic-like serine/threonine-protein kinase
MSLFLDGVNACDEIKAQLKLLAKDINFTRESNKGNNGHLFFGNNRILNREVAVKFYYWGGQRKYHAEPHILAGMRSANILVVHNAGLIDGKWAYFVTPYCTNGDMDDLLSQTQVGNLTAIDLTCGLLSGLGELHQNRFLHRDLKPANIYIDDNKRAIIGDFGSIRFLPEGEDNIPASGHAILYRPPEAVQNNIYGVSGDLYQVGIVLYQLLGGRLPYDEIYWLSAKEKLHYDTLLSDADRSIYSDDCLKKKILKGNVLDMSSLPPWVPDNLKKVIRKATHLDPLKRFASASAFHIHLNNLRATIPNWSIIEGIPTLVGKASYRVLYKNDKVVVQKSKDGNIWRADNSFANSSFENAIGVINLKG